jgi:hypothetical protein
MNRMQEPIGGFVFVVCGGREHIDTLHFSLRALKRFTVHPITVVTDSRRNEVPVVHESVIDVPTPEHLDHHQASIWLKTSLHRILPEGLLYCYLDTDVVALSSEADQVFEEFVPPVTFAPDHCTLDRFSPRAVKCGCLEEHLMELDIFQQKAESAGHAKEEYQRLIGEIDFLVESSRSNRLTYLIHRLRFLWPGRFYRLSNRFMLEKSSGRWFSTEGVDLLDRYGFNENILRLTGMRWSGSLNDFVRPDGRPLSELRCAHLHERTMTTLGVRIEEGQWQHWNGGVFLFGAESAPLMDLWHRWTMQIFGMPEWRTRDQGTLAASAWKLGLQHHACLDTRFNFIVDHNSRSQKYLGDLTFDNGDGQSVRPVLAHVFHHFGDMEWEVWAEIERHSRTI